MDTGETRKSRKLLTAIVVLQVLTLLGLWTGQPHASETQAAVPDPGAQREAHLAEQKKTNEKLDQLMEVLKSGEVKIKVERK